MRISDWSSDVCSSDLEPPPATIFLLVSHAPGRLLPTIRSRCRMMRFQPLPDDQIRQVIAMERPDISEAELAALLRIAEGVSGKALRYAGLAIDRKSAV